MEARRDCISDCAEEIISMEGDPNNNLDINQSNSDGDSKCVETLRTVLLD